MQRWLSAKRYKITHQYIAYRKRITTCFIQHIAFHVCLNLDQVIIILSFSRSKVIEIEIFKGSRDGNFRMTNTFVLMSKFVSQPLFLTYLSVCLLHTHQLKVSYVFVNREKEASRLCKNLSLGGVQLFITSKGRSCKSLGCKIFQI